MRIIDSHVHIRGIADGHEPLYGLAGRLGYEKLAVMSLQCYEPLQNTAVALCKLGRPEMTYAFGGLDYITGRDFEAQAENLRAMGYDGVKMLEGKPTTRRLLKKALDDPEYDAFFTYLEDTGFPVVMHVADPDTFWDKNRAPRWAVEQGWLYDEKDQPYEQYYIEVENLLAGHPRLKAIFAHFFFLSWNAERAQRFLDEHPSVFIDITAGIEMYENFSLDPPFWRGFFTANKDRIIFGTDSTDELPDDTAISINGYAQMEIEFLRYDRPIEIYGMKLHGLGLPDDTCERIFAKNFIGLAGGKPRPMDRVALKKEAELLRNSMGGENSRLAMDKMIGLL